MKKLVFKYVLLGFILLFSTAIVNQVLFIPDNKYWQGNCSVAKYDSTFELKVGDILVRPNWNWFPGTEKVPMGRKVGHLGIVVKGAKGNNLEEVVENSEIIESYIFDQKTRSFIFGQKDKVRQRPASISFNKKFKGIRYFLRYPLTIDQADSLALFLNNVKGGDYNLFSFKTLNKLQFFNDNEGNQLSWNCVSLVWAAYKSVVKVDLDANGGYFLYPNDVLCSSIFDARGRRVNF